MATRKKRKEKKESSVLAMSVNGLGRNEQSS
jgi:hypothetical protein